MGIKDKANLDAVFRTKGVKLGYPGKNKKKKHSRGICANFLQSAHIFWSGNTSETTIS